MKIISNFLNRRQMNKAVSRWDNGELIALLKAGVDPNHLYRGNSPLLIAVKRDDRKLIDLLVEFGASYTHSANAGVLKELVRSNNLGHIEIVAPLMDKAELNDALHLAIRYRMVETAKLFIKLGAQIGDKVGEQIGWHRLNSETIRFLQSHGLVIPEEVESSVSRGEWDRRDEARSYKFSSPPMTSEDIDRIEQVLEVKVPEELVELFKRSDDFQNYIFTNRSSIIGMTQDFRSGEYVPESVELDWPDSYLIFGHSDVGDSFCLDTEAKELSVFMYSHETIEVVEQWSTLEAWAKEIKSLVDRYHN